MILYPAIDLKDNKCVRLVQGKMDQETVFGENAGEMAARWVAQGAKWLHVVDLNGAFTGYSVNLPAIRAIVRTAKVPVQLGGGIRTMDHIRSMLEEIGIQRVILGTVAIEQPQLVSEAVACYGNRIAVGIDASQGKVAVKGWAEATQVTPLELGKRMVALGVETFIYTDISRDGMLSGPNFDATRSLIEATGAQVIVSGGVASLSDITRAKEIKASGVILGKAIYTGAIKLDEALKEA
jgi:phosphoribosylformimino-5-aminoimidazole carboxamide ribotide isomerase